MSMRKSIRATFENYILPELANVCWGHDRYNMVKTIIEIRKKQSLSLKLCALTSLVTQRYGTQMTSDHIYCVRNSINFGCYKKTFF